MARVLLIGSGGRESAFAYKLAQSPHCQQLFVAPGNAGTAAYATNVELNPMNFTEIADFCQKEAIDLLVVGPEAPLVAGLRDALLAIPALRQLRVVGPSKAAARLEGSKDFAKQFMQKYGIPTARYRTFTAEQKEEALAYVHQHPLPVVLKADGLAAGKGVIICQEHGQAVQVLTEMLSGKFGEASRKVVVEEYLSGMEVSVFVLTDGSNYLMLPEAKDYKRVGEADTGPNTGGMGAVSPVYFVDDIFRQKVESRIVQPTLAGLQKEGMPYCGFIFLGLMNVEGEPYVIEYNVRMGDPETQAVLARIESDWLLLLQAAASGQLARQKLEISPYTALALVLASEGYPDAYQTGKSITGIEELQQDVLVFHAGTRLSADGTLQSAGGRVLAITALAADLEQARHIAMQAAEVIHFENKYYRKDIGLDLLGRQQIGWQARKN